MKYTEICVNYSNLILGGINSYAKTADGQFELIAQYREIVDKFYDSRLSREKKYTLRTMAHRINRAYREATGFDLRDSK